MNLTDKDNALLRKHLYGETEFKHALEYRNINRLEGLVGCKRCDKALACDEFDTEYIKGVPGRNHFYSDNPCPVPPPFNISGAELAEDVRKWMARQCEDLSFNWYQEMMELESWRNHAQFHVEGELSEWMLINATPRDKITAALSVMKGME